jgi:hypothetical protein
MKPKSTPKSRQRVSRVSPQRRDEGKKVASRKATSGTVSAATSKSAQKAKAAQLSRPGKIVESGMTLNSVSKLISAGAKWYTTPKAGSARLPGAPPVGRAMPKPPRPSGPPGLGIAQGIKRPQPKKPADKPSGSTSKPSGSTPSGKWSPGKGVQGTTGSPGKKPSVVKKPASPPKWSSKTRASGKK